jgi:hypothetical protein
MQTTVNDRKPQAQHTLEGSTDVAACRDSDNV